MGLTKLLSIAQFAKATGLGYRMARKLVLSGEVNSVKVGRRRRVDSRQIDRWLQWEEAQPTGPAYCKGRREGREQSI
jgi:excisionase family DNA binding protein